MQIEFRIFEEVPVASYNDYSILLEGELGAHKKKHVHLKKKANRLASVAIDDGEVLAGEVPRDIRKPLKLWVAKYRACLLKDWDGMQEHKHPHEYPLDLS